MSDTAVEAVDASGLQINRFGNLPALPEVTSRIMSALKDPDIRPGELSRLITSDVALSARILKVVNSVFYGLPRQISSIERAVVVLGRNAVRNITIAASMAKVFNATGRLSNTRFNMKTLWTHSTATASASRLLCQEIHHGDPNEYFLAGLTHDIGIMAELYWSHELLADCVDQTIVDSNGVPVKDLRTFEMAAFGADHEQSGCTACEEWNFPKPIAVAAGSHHEPLTAEEEHRKLAAVVHIADRISASLPESFRVDLPTLDVSDDVLDELRLNRDSMERIRDFLIAEMAEVQQIFS